MRDWPHVDHGQLEEAAMPVEMTPRAFDEAVADALDSVPERLLNMLSNVAFFVEEEPDDDLGMDCLGVYDGVPQTDRGWDVGAPVMPDRITIFRGPTLRCCDTARDVVEEVRVTVIHEIAHHFGIDDERLTQLGWD